MGNGSNDLRHVINEMSNCGHVTLSCAINILKPKSFAAVSVYMLALKQHQFSSLDLAATKI